jgi:hypothetical protein
MEIRINTHGPDSLATRTFYSDEGCFYFAMVQRFPDANLAWKSNRMNAGVFKAGIDWNSQWQDEG